MQEDGRTDEEGLASFHQTFVYGRSIKMMYELDELLPLYHFTDMQLLVRCAAQNTHAQQNQTKVSARNLE